MDAIDKALAKMDGPWEHSPLMCGISEETDCPVCVLKYWPLRRQDALQERLAQAGIDYHDLAELLLRPIQPKVEKIIRSVLTDSLRSQQLALFEAFFFGPDRDTLREHLRDLLFDDMVAIAEACISKRTSRGRKISRSA